MKRIKMVKALRSKITGNYFWSPPRFLTGLHASFQDPERLFFVMDFLGGGDLMHHMMQVMLMTMFMVKIMSCGWR